VHYKIKLHQRFANETIFLLFALSLFVTSSPQVSIAGTDELFSEATQSERKVTLPHPVLVKAITAYKDEKLPQADFQALLQLMFLEYSPAFMRANIFFFENEGGHEKLLKELEKARKEVVSVRWKPVYEIYKYEKKIKHHDLSSAWHIAWQRYPSWADLIRYRMDIVQENIDRATLEFQYEQIFREAQIGLRPAMLFLADHFERGFNLEKSVFKSVFWLLMAQWEGADVKQQLERLSPRLSDNNLQKIKNMIKENKYPDVMVMPKDGWQMRGGPNGRWTPPYMKANN
jgi:hypothetical protein